MKRIIVFLSVGAALMLQAAAGYCQENQQTSPQITSERMRLLILPVERDFPSVANEISGLVASIATDLGRFEVIDRNNLERILQEQALQQTGAIDDAKIVNFGKIATAREALVIKVLHFSQKGVKPADEEVEDRKRRRKDTTGEKIVKKVVEGVLEASDIELYPNNIQTNLSVEVRKVDTESGQSLQSFVINTTHTGGPVGESRAKVMQDFRNKAVQQIKQLYILSSEVVSVQGNHVLLFLGTDIGVREGTVFEIVEPDRIETHQSRQITIPGKSAALVKVSELSSESNRSKVMRRWRRIEPGYRAIEHTGFIFAVQVSAIPPVAGEYFTGGVSLHALPMGAFDAGLGFRFIGTTDSYDENVYGAGAGAFASYRLLRSSLISIRAKAGLDFDALFKTDEKDNSVNAGMVSVPLGLIAEVFLGAKTDLVFEAGYRLGGTTSKWEYTEEEENYPAVWSEEAPELDISDVYFSLGIKQYIF